MTGTMTQPRKRKRSGKSPETNKPKPNRTANVGVQFYVDGQLFAALNAYLDSLPEDQRPKKRGLYSAAIRQYLESKGYWPPPAPSAD